MIYDVCDYTWLTLYLVGLGRELSYSQEGCSHDYGGHVYIWVKCDWFKFIMNCVDAFDLWGYDM